MPRVPRARRTESAVGIPNVGVPTGLPAGAFGEGGAKVGREAERLAVAVYQQEREKANRLRHSEERRALNGWEVENIHDSQKGAMSRRGRDAFGLPEELMENFDAFVAERTQGLSNDEQRANYSSLVDSRRETLNRWSHKYVGDQIRAVEGEEYTSSLESSKERGAIDTDNARLETEYIKNTVMDRSVQQGWSKAETQQELQKHTTDLHKRAIEELQSQGRDVEAEEYFKAAQGSMDKDVVRGLRADLKTRNADREAARLAQNIWDEQGPREDLDPVNLDVMAKSARDLSKDQKVIDATVTRLKQRGVLHNASVTQRTDANKATLYEAYDGGAGLDQITDMPEYIELPGDEKSALRKKIEGYIKAEARAERAEDRINQQINFGILISSPQALREADIDHMLRNEELSIVGHGALLIAKDPLKSRQARDAFKLLNFAKTKRLFNSQDDADNLGRWAEYNELLSDYITRHPDGDPVEFANEMMKEVELSYKDRLANVLWFGQPATEAALTQKEERLRQMAAEITPERQQAIDMLRTGGKPITERNINAVLERINAATR